MAEEISVTKYADDIIFLGESSNDLKQLMKVKKESAKTGLHFNIKNIKIMIVKDIHNFNTDAEEIEIAKDVTYLGLLIKSNEDCSREIKRRLRLGRSAMEKLGKISSTSLYSQLL